MNECWPTRSTSFLRSALCSELWSWHRVAESRGVSAGKSACFDVKTVVEIDGLKAGPTRSHVALRSIPIERSKSSSRRTSSSSDSSNNLATNLEHELALVFEKPGRYTLPILDITQIRSKYLHQGRASIQARDALFLLTSTHQIELERLLEVIRDVKAVKILADSRMCSACEEKGELKKKKIKQKKGQQQQQPTVQEGTFRKRQLPNLVDTDEEHVYHIKDLLRNRGHGSQKLSKVRMPLSESRDFRPSEIDDEVYHNASSSSEILSPEHTTAFRYSPVQTRGREAHLAKQSSPTKHEVFIDQIRRRNTLDGVRRRDAPRVVNEQRSVRSSDEEKENLDVGADEDIRKIKDETVKRSAQRVGTNEVLTRQEEQRRVEEDKRHKDVRRKSELDEMKEAEEKEKMLKRKESLRKLLEQERKRKDEWEAKREEERRRKEEEGKKLKAEEERLEKSLERHLQEDGRLGKDEKRKDDERRRIFLDFRFQEEKRTKEEDRRVQERKQREESKMQEQKLREEERKLLDQKQREEERKLLDQKKREEERKLLDQKQREEERKLPDQKQREEERKLLDLKLRAEERQVLDQKQREEERQVLDQKQREERNLQDLKERQEEHKLHKQKWRDEEYKGVTQAGRSQELKQSEEDDNEFSEALRKLQEQIQEKRKRDEDLMQETLDFLKQEEDRQKLRKFQESAKITDRLSQRFRRNRVSAEGKMSPDEIRKILEEQLDKLDSRKLEEDMRRWRTEENDRRAKEDNWAMPHHKRSVLEEQRRRVEEVFSRRLSRNASERMKVDLDDRKQSPEQTEDFKVHLFSSAEVKRAPDSCVSQKRYSQDRRFLDQLFSSRRMQIPRSDEGKAGKGGESFRPTETFVKADISSVEELKKSEMERKKAEKAADEQKKRLAQERLKAAKLETKRLEKVLREAQKRAKAEERQSQQQKGQEQARQKLAAMAPPGLPKVHNLTYRQYEDSWNVMKTAGRKVLLAYSDIPWPPHSNPLFVELDDTLAVQRRKLRIALLRWHPDKFQSLCGNRLSPLDRGSIEARAKTIAQEVILWKSKLENNSW